MGENHHYWEKWADFLHRWGLLAPASTVLEAAGPLTAVVAQLVYFGQPLFSRPSPESQWQALAEMLAGKFPEELASRLPPKRRPWMSEDPRMDIFDAVGLAVAFWPPGK